MDEYDVKLEIELNHKKDIGTMDFTPDGRYLIVGHSKEIFTIWDF